MSEIDVSPSESGGSDLALVYAKIEKCGLYGYEWDDGSYG